MAPKPIFAMPPSCVIKFSSERNFINLLLKHKVPYWEWGEKERQDTLKEIADGDAVYYFDEHYNIVRFICVIAMRVVMLHPRLGRLALVEFVREGEFYRPRDKLDLQLVDSSSLSEKIVLDRTSGIPIETSIETIGRCFIQETGMRIPSGELRQHTTFMPWPLASTGSRWVEVDKDESKKRPGTRNHRQVAHYNVELLPRHYREGYQDRDTRYYAFWHSTAHLEGALEPISAEIVQERMRRIQRKRAVA